MPLNASFGRFTLFIVLAVCIFLQSNVGRADEVIPADPPLRWWKGNLHTHTFWSDGNDFPEMVAEWYRTHGYNFLALSDHNVLSQGQKWMKQSAIVKRGAQAVDKYRARFGDAWIETRGARDDLEFRLKPFEEYRALVEERGRFLMIPSEEISDKAEGVPIHINATNLKDPLPPLGGATVHETMTNNLRAVHEQAESAGREILAHLNHPNFGWAITAHDLAHVMLERHFEVYNGHPGVNHRGDEHRPGTERLWDIANTIRLVDLQAAPLFGIATDDTHSYHDHPGGDPKGSRPGRGWVMARTTHLTPESIVRAIKAGDCYASSGVTLAEVDYDATKKTLELAIEPDSDAKFTTQFIGTLRGVDTAAVDSAVPAKLKGRVSKKYSDQIGVVLATSAGPRPKYELTGRELYVRAVVTSTKPPVDPSFPGQLQQAWTQPVGWETTTQKAAGQ